MDEATEAMVINASLVSFREAKLVAGRVLVGTVELLSVHAPVQRFDCALEIWHQEMP